MIIFSRHKETDVLHCKLCDEYIPVGPVDDIVGPLVEHVLSAHFVKTEDEKRLSCPWCIEEKKLPFRTAKAVKLRAHLERDHKFCCAKCPDRTFSSDKIIAHLTTCQEYLDQGQIQKRQIHKNRPQWDAQLKSAHIEEPVKQEIKQEKSTPVQVKSVSVQTLGLIFK